MVNKKKPIITATFFCINLPCCHLQGPPGAPGYRGDHGPKGRPVRITAETFLTLN